MRILVRTPNWVGDSVMSLPFFDMLPICFPHSHTDILVKDSSIQTVFHHHPAIRKAFPFSKTDTRGFTGLFTYGRSLRQHGPYDIFLSLPTSFSSALIGYATGTPIRAGYTGEGRAFLLTHRFRRPRHVHQVVSYLVLLRDLCRRLHTSADARFQAIQCPEIEQITSIQFPFSEEEQRTRLLQTQEGAVYIAVNVNSEAQSRRLPEDTWRQLSNKLLQESRMRLVFIGTPNERPRVERVMQALTSQANVLDFCGNYSVRELAILLRDVDLLVSNNSGPVHLANAVGTPVMTFGGAAGKFETEPFDQKKALVINKHLPCSPCWKNVCRFPTVRCLEAISVDELYESTLKMLRNA